MKNKKDIGKNALPEHRETIQSLAPKWCIGGCPTCGDYIMQDNDKAVCVYCDFTESITKWNKRK